MSFHSTGVSMSAERRRSFVGDVVARHGAVARPLQLLSLVSRLRQVRLRIRYGVPQRSRCNRQNRQNPEKR